MSHNVEKCVLWGIIYMVCILVCSRTEFMPLRYLKMYPIGTSSTKMKAFNLFFSGYIYICMALKGLIHPPCLVGDKGKSGGIQEEAVKGESIPANETFLQKIKRKLFG